MIEYAVQEDGSTQIYSHCIDCCFSIGNDKEQTGCQLGRLEKFAQRGVKPAKIKAENEFLYFRIPRVCTTFRPSEWENIIGEEDPIEQVYKEISLRLSFILLFMDHTYQQLLDTLISLSEQTLPVREAIIVNWQKNISLPKLLTDLRKDVSNLNWKLTSIMDDREYTNNQLIDIGYTKVTGNFYATMDCGETLIKDFLMNINHAINIELESFSLLKSDLYSVKIYDANTHKHPMMEGNIPITMKNDEEEVKLNSLEEKIQWVDSKMVKKVEEICPSLVLQA